MKNKFIFIILLFLLLFSAFLSTFSSASFIFTHNDKNYTFPDFEHEDYFLIYKMPSSTGFVIYSFSNFKDFSYYSFIKSTNPSSSSSVYFKPVEGQSIHQITYHYNMNSSGKLVKINEIDITNNLGAFSIFEEYIIFSSFDFLDSDKNIIFDKNKDIYADDSLSFELFVSPTEKTTKVPVTINTCYYSVDFFSDILVQYSYDNKKWKDCSWRRLTDSDSPFEGCYQFYLDVYSNDTYYFKFTDLKTMTVKYKTVTVDNIIYTQDNSGDYKDGVFDPTPFLAYEYVSDSEVLITTQKFFIYELIDLQCYWGKDLSEDDLKDDSKWTKADIRTFKDSITGEDTYQFYFSVKNDNFDADGTYFVKFDNVFLNKTRSSSIKIDFNSILNINGSWLWKYVNFFKERFGFLVYPFELAINVLNKFKRIEFDEPSFVIPDLYEPVTNTKLISSTRFSFNDLLKNDVFNNIHNIYLVVVDAIIVFGIVILLKNKILEVFDK